MKPYLVLLRVEFTLQPTVTSGPVRSYRTLSALPVLLPAIGGLLSAALVVGSRPPDVIWHPALWSPDFPPLYLSTRRYNGKAAIVSSTRGAFYLKFTTSTKQINSVSVVTKQVLRRDLQKTRFLDFLMQECALI